MSRHHGDDDTEEFEELDRTPARLRRFMSRGAGDGRHGRSSGVAWFWRIFLFVLTFWFLDHFFPQAHAAPPPTPASCVAVEHTVGHAHGACP